MSNRVSGDVLKRTVSAAAIAVTAMGLAGCSSLGSLTTGATSTSASTDLAQTMPPPLTDVAPTDAPYIPPANVGRSEAGSVATGDLAQSGQANVNSVSSQDLPPLTSSGSTQPMLAQPTTSPVQVASADPAIAPVPADPKLTVIPDNAYVHVVQSGESLYSIARQYNVTTDAIVSANSLVSADRIFVGQKLVIPGLTASHKTTEKSEPVTTASLGTPATPLTTATKPAATPVAPTTQPVQTAVTPTQPSGAISGGFLWPLSGSVLVDFASSKSGINIAAAEGASVRAAEGGQVIYVGSAVEGYGNLVLIKHDNGYVSAYAHLKEINVAKGATVNRGDIIGAAGMTGSVSRPQLHFELRKGATPVDPMPLLVS